MEKKNKWLIAGACMLVAAATVLGLYQNKHIADNKISYTSFLELLNNNQIDEVQLSSNEEIKFKLKNQETSYTTDNPRKENFKEELLLQNVAVKESESNTLYTLQYLMSMAMMGLLFFVIFKGVKKGGMSQGNMGMGVKPVEPEALKTDFSHLAGNEEAKMEVQDVIAFMKEPERFAKMGARMPKGIILYGPPGTGKTLMAKAVAKEAGVAFFSVSGSDFVQLYVGVGASRVRELFKEARKHKKAVIFIDEIDAIGKKRSQNAMQSNDEKDQTLNALLTEMSGFKESEGIVVIAATNRLDTLDEALLRPGRFDRQVEVGYPDLKAREAIIKLYLRNKPIADGISAESLAKQTVYFTGAMLENLLNEAAILVATQGESIITKKHIDAAFYTVVAGREKKDRSNISDLDRRITAFHEAGHTLVTKIVAPENTVSKVTIIPSTKGAGGFSMNIPKDKMYLTKEELINRIKISLAGRAAEELVFGENRITTGASNDLEKASQDIKNYMTSYGMDKHMGLLNIKVVTGKEETDNEELIRRCRKELAKLYKETQKTIYKNKDKLYALAESLLEKETLDEKEIASFF